MSQLVFHGLGWKSRIRKVRNSCFILIPKPLALGNFLQKGDILEQFVAKINDKVALITMLDNQQTKEFETINIEKNTFLIKKIA